MATVLLLGPATTHRRDARREARRACCSGGCSRSCAWSTAGRGNPGRAPGTPRRCTLGTRRWLPGSGARRTPGWKIKRVALKERFLGGMLFKRGTAQRPGRSRRPHPGRPSTEGEERGASGSWPFPALSQLKGGSQQPNVRRVVAAPAARAHASPAGPGAGAELGPGAPAAVLAVGLLRCLPDAVTLEAPLERRKKRGELYPCLFQSARHQEREPSYTHSTTKTAHSLQSRGGRSSSSCPWARLSHRKQGQEQSLGTGWQTCPPGWLGDQQAVLFHDQPRSASSRRLCSKSPTQLHSRDSRQKTRQRSRDKQGRLPAHPHFGWSKKSLQLHKPAQKLVQKEAEGTSLGRAKISLQNKSL